MWRWPRGGQIVIFSQLRTLRHFMVMFLGIIIDSESKSKVLKPCSSKYIDYAPYRGPHGRTGNDNVLTRTDHLRYTILDHALLYSLHVWSCIHLQHAILKGICFHLLNSSHLLSKIVFFNSNFQIILTLHSFYYSSLEF